MDADFDFVEKFVLDGCTNAKIKYGGATMTGRQVILRTGQSPIASSIRAMPENEIPTAMLASES